MANKPSDNIQDMLVAYSDGEFSIEERAQIDGHLAACEACRAELQALERSLELTKVIWRDQEANLTRIEPQHLGRKNRRSGLRWAALAAGILIALGGILIWRAISPPEKYDVPTSPISEPTLAEIERAVNRAGIAAQMLAVADYLAKIPGGEPFAKDSYSYLVNTYGDIEAGQQAKKRLQTYFD
jgi:predicted anti-sigma-YlaC factor YlaD